VRAEITHVQHQSTPGHERQSHATTAIRNASVVVIVIAGAVKLWWWCIPMALFFEAEKQQVPPAN
jgi:hypothetical protein